MNETLYEKRLQAAKDLDAAADLIERVGHWRSGIPSTSNRNRDLLEGSTCAGNALSKIIEKSPEAGDWNNRLNAAGEALCTHLNIGRAGLVSLGFIYRWNDANDEATILKAMRDTAGELRLTAAIDDPSQAWLD